MSAAMAPRFYCSLNRFCVIINAHMELGQRVNMPGKSTNLGTDSQDAYRWRPCTAVHMNSTPFL